MDLEHDEESNNDACREKDEGIVESKESRGRSRERRCGGSGGGREERDFADRQGGKKERGRFPFSVWGGGGWLVGEWREGVLRG